MTFVTPTHNFYGFSLIEDRIGACVHRVQVKFPRSKKARIRKKWAKMDRYKEDRPCIIRAGDTIFVHRDLMPALMRRLKMENHK